MKIRPVFAWYDFWIGLYWDRDARTLYAMIPFVGVAFDCGKEERVSFGIRLDARTCDSCRALDGLSFPKSEAKARIAACENDGRCIETVHFFPAE